MLKLFICYTYNIYDTYKYLTYKFIALKDNENVNMEILNERTGVNGWNSKDNRSE